MSDAKKETAEKIIASGAKLECLYRQIEIVQEFNVDGLTFYGKKYDAPGLPVDVLLDLMRRGIRDYVQETHVEIAKLLEGMGYAFKSAQPHEPLSDVIPEA